MSAAQGRGNSGPTLTKEAAPLVNQEEANRDVLKLLDLKDRNVIPWLD